MKFKFNIDMMVGDVSVTELEGYAIIGAVYDDPDEGWSIDDIVLKGVRNIGANGKHSWVSAEAELDMDHPLYEPLVAQLLADSRDAIHAKWREFHAADTAATAVDRRLDDAKHAGVM
jgi:hypothetical protein